jgi:nucleoside 2-deoxyribosyltransferase
MNNIYLAGADVFRADALDYFERIKALCEKYGFTGLSPFDNENFDGELFSKAHSKSIFLSNVDLIQKCNIIIVNLNPFRGACVDDGSAFEMGVGFSLKKIIYGYTQFHNEKLKDITETYFNYNYLKQKSEFPNIENFGNNCVNLMLQESIELFGGKILPTFEDCLIDLKNNHFNVKMKVA